MCVCVCTHVRVCNSLGFLHFGKERPEINEGGWVEVRVRPGTQLSSEGSSRPSTQLTPG